MLDRTEYGIAEYGVSRYTREVIPRTINLMQYLPWFYQESDLTIEIQEASEMEFVKLNTDADDLRDQFFLDTATWGLAFYEERLGLITDLLIDLDIRRGNIRAKMRGAGSIGSELIKNVVASYTNGMVSVDFDGKIHIIFNDIKGIPSNMDDVYRVLRDICPSHLDLVYKFLYTTWGEIKAITWDEVTELTWAGVRVK